MQEFSDKLQQDNQQVRNELDKEKETSKKQALKLQDFQKTDQVQNIIFYYFRMGRFI